MSNINCASAFASVSLSLLILSISFCSSLSASFCSFSFCFLASAILFFLAASSAFNFSCLFFLISSCSSHAFFIAVSCSLLTLLSSVNAVISPFIASMFLFISPVNSSYTVIVSLISSILCSDSIIAAFSISIVSVNPAFFMPNAVTEVIQVSFSPVSRSTFSCKIFLYSSAFISAIASAFAFSKVKAAAFFKTTFSF